MQSSYVISKEGVQIIVINVDKGSRDEAQKFIRRESPTIFHSNKIKFVEQPGFPDECVSDEEEEDENKLADLPGTDFGLYVGTQVAYTDKDRDTKIPGTIGGYLYDKKSVTLNWPGQLYGCTAGHVLTGSRKQVASNEDKSGTIFIECVNRDTRKDFQEEVDIRYFDNWDIGSNIDIDVGLIPLANKVVRHKSTVFLQNNAKEYVTLEAFQGPYKDMEQKVVHKIGNMLDQTVGQIVEVDLDRRFKGYIMSGYFVVKPTGKETAFALKGHSGAWVTDVIKDQAKVPVYGIIQGKQDDYRHVVVKDGVPVEDEPLSVGLCLHFHNQISALNDRCDMDLAIYNAQSDKEIVKSRGNDESRSSSTKTCNVKDSKEKKVITYIRTAKRKKESAIASLSRDKPSSAAIEVVDSGPAATGKEIIGQIDEMGDKELHNKREGNIGGPHKNGNARRCVEGAEEGDLISLPDSWEPMTNTESVVVKQVPWGSEEYNQVEDRFAGSMRRSKYTYTSIVEIQRVQNPLLYRTYMATKADMEKKHVSKYPLERTAWHATSEEALSEINANGFSKASSIGKLSEIWGMGVYFDREAGLSLRRFSKPNDTGYKYLYMAKVLSGDYVQGSMEMKTAPSKDARNPHLQYDSVVDDTSSPTMWVISSNHQMYAEYVIVFKD